MTPTNSSPAVDIGSRRLVNLDRRKLLALTASLGLGAIAGCSAGDESPGEPTARTPSEPIPKLTNALVTRWRQDPFARGSYSYLAADARPSDRRLLATSSANRLFFAGEATSNDFPATVHGALHSGRRAAAEILTAGASSVVIVGAGMAGLEAGAQLARAGVDVRIVEARDRIGGRVRTDRSLGLPLDIGASWIHGVNGNPLSGLADAVDAVRTPTDYDNRIVRDDDGEIVATNDIPAEFDDITEIEHEFAADIEALSRRAVEEGEAYGGADVLFPNGYDEILQPLADAVEVELGAIVTRIDTSADAVKVDFAESSYEGDAVLVTVPLGVLKAGSIEFTPPLSTEHLGAIERLGMGLLDKVYLRFERVFWDADVDLIGYIGPKRGYFAEWLNMYKYLGEPILLGFNAASAADEIEEMTDEQIVAESMAALRAMYRS